MLDEMLETYDEYDEYDESDFESDFDDLEFDESRRRRRRRPRRRRVGTSGPAWRRQRPPSRGGRTADQLKREADAGRTRDKQLAREVNSTKEDVSDVAGQLKKVNADLSSLRQISLISMLLPRSLDIQRQNLTVSANDQQTGQLTTTTNPVGPGVVSTVSGVTSKLDILPLVLFMSMGKGIGKPGKSSGGFMGDNSMMLVVLLLLMQQQQQQQQSSGTSGSTSTGGLDTTMLLLVLMASGGL
jgi:hypothetical protein